MAIPLLTLIPKRLAAPKPATDIRVSPLLQEMSLIEAQAVLQKLQTSRDGLSPQEAQNRLEKYAPNAVAQVKRHTRLRLLGKALVNPLVFLTLVCYVFFTQGVKWWLLRKGWI